MRIAFFGTTAIGLACCEEALAAGHEIVGVVSAPREFEISYAETPVRNVNFVDFSEFAHSRGIPYLEVASSRADPILSAITDWQPDFGLAVGWFYLLPTQVRQLFPLGIAGIHASLLPKNRGGAPLVWAMINGERTTGVTLFYIDGGVDTGDVIGQAAFDIAQADDIANVLAKATSAAVALVRSELPRIATGTAARIPQDETHATTNPQRRPDDGVIDWSNSATSIQNFIRAQTRPYPGAFTELGGKRVTIWDATVEDSQQ